MGKHLVRGLKYCWSYFDKKILLIVIGWLVLSSILVNGLFLYSQYYANKETTTIIQRPCVIERTEDRGIYSQYVINR